VREREREREREIRERERERDKRERERERAKRWNEILSVFDRFFLIMRFIQGNRIEDNAM
jgi:hypothetical protein